MIQAPLTQVGTTSAASAAQGTTVNVTVNRQPDMYLGLARAVFSAFGLNTDALIARFNQFIGTNELQRWATHFRNQQTTVNLLRANQNNPVWNTNVYVYPWFLEKLREFGINFTISSGGDVRVSGISAGASVGGAAGGQPSGAPGIDKPVSQMTASEKVAEAIRRAIPLLPAEVREEVKTLLTPEALAIAVGVLVVWAASHFIGVGEVVDVILLVVGVFALGAVAWKAGEELINFATKSVNASNSEDLDQAARHFADAVALIGVQAVMALLLKGRPRTFRNPHQNSATITPAMVARSVPPRTPGRFYRPKTTPDPTRAEGTGGTSIFGGIVYSSQGSLDTQRLVRIHEKVHQFLTPKLYPLRNVRVTLAINGYNKSFILRYVEEALAETVAQVSVNGWRSAIDGIAFPIRNGYLTIRNPRFLSARQIRNESLANIGREATGILLGPINVGGMIYHVYQTFTAPSTENMQEVTTR